MQQEIYGREPSSPSYSPAARTTTVARSSGSPTQDAFVQAHLEEAQRVAQETGIPWQVLLAIPGNETGWGAAKVGENYFGIKGSNPKTGASSGPVGTWEVVNGQRVDIQDSFRAYSGYEESARDFAQFLKDNPRYSKALAYLQKQPDDWRGFTREVHAAGYATDPEWSNKIINIGNGIGDDERPPVMTAASANRLPADRTGRAGIQSVLDVGQTAIGSKYVWGGAGGRTNFDPTFVGSDCSGFVAWAYQQATGMRLPAYTGDLWTKSVGIDSKDAAPGDLVMYNMGQGARMEHVGIYAGNGMMLHDSSINPNGGVDITPLWKGAQFRRVPVDSNLANYSTRDAGRDAIAPDDHIESWYITVHGGRQVFVGTTKAGNTTTDDLGPAQAGMVQGQVLGASGGLPALGAGQADGNDKWIDESALAMQKIGAGQDDETDYSFLDTPLSPAGEGAFQVWKAQYAPKDSGWDYDLRGAYAAGLVPDPSSGHWPDTYKKPNHPTFSDQSKFAAQYPDRAGHWDGETYVPPMGAGQDDGEVYDQDTLDRMRQEEEARRLALEQQERENREREEEARRQAQYTEVDRPFQFPEQPNALRNRPEPNPNPVEQFVRDTSQNLTREAERAGQAFVQSAQQGTLSTDLAGTLGGMIGGAASAIGTTARGVADTLGEFAAGTPEAIGEAALQESQQRRETVETVGEAAQAVPEIVQAAPEAISQAVQAIPEKVGGAASAIGTTARNVADVVGPAAEWLNQQTPGRGAMEFLEKPETQGAIQTANNIVGAVSPGTAVQTMAPGVQAIIDWNRANGFEGMLNAPAPPPKTSEPGSLQARAAQGQVLGPHEQAKLIWEGMEAAEEARRESVKAAMPPEIRDSPEGFATTEAIVLATDPLNYIGGELFGAAKAGKKILVEGAPIAIKAASPEGRAAIQAAIEGTTRATPSIAAQIKKQEGIAEAAAKLAAESAPTMRMTGGALAQELEPAVARAVSGGPPIGTPEEVQAAADAAQATRQAVSQRAADWLAAEAAVRGTPEEIAFGNEVAEALDRPYSVQEAMNILQSAALHLNDKALSESAEALKLLNAAGNKHEPLTGEQLRRVVINAVARNSPVLEADYTPKYILGEVDKIMKQAGHPLLSSDAVATRVPSPSEILDARMGWWETEAARKAHAYEEQRKLTFAMMDQYRQNQALRALRETVGTVGPPLARASVGAALGAAHEIGTTPGDQQVDYGKTAMKAGVAGFATAVLGSGPAMGLVSKYVTRPTLDAAAATLAPVMRFEKPVREATEEWTGNLDLAHQLSKQLKEEWASVFGSKIRVEDQAFFEINGRFPQPMMDRPGAEEAVEHWKEIAKWAKDQGLIEAPIQMTGTHGTPRVYIPHILDKEYQTKGLKMAGENKQRGMLSRNPMRYFNQHRQYFTMYDGMFSPGYGTPDFIYSEAMPDHLANYYERTIQAAAHRLYIQRLHELSLQRTPDILTSGEKMKPEDLIRIPQPGPGIYSIPANAKKLDGIKGFEYFPELQDVYVSPQMESALSTIMGNDKGIRDSWLGNAVMDANAMFKLNVLSGIDAYHILNEIRQLFSTQGWNAVVGGKGAGIQVATGLAAGAAGAAQELSQENPNYALAGVKAAAAFGLGTALTSPLGPGRFLPEPMQGGGTLWLAFAHALSPSLHQQWLRDPVVAKRIQRGIRDGLQMTIVPDLPEHLNIRQRFTLAALNTVSGGIGAYQAAMMGGASQEEAINWGLGGAAMGLGLSTPLPFGKEQRSIVEHVASRTFDQLIPFMKYTTYEMYAPKFGGRAAAEFSNEVFGGQNILAIGRSRMVQDVMRLAVLAPDWQEGWARLVGNGLFNWGADKPVGTMARMYWRNALVQSAVMLEGMNLAVNGTWSWQNDPNGTLMVKASNFYDLMGFNRTNPRTGEQYDPYWDILGPYRGMLEPALESARWVMAGMYQGLGFRPERIPFYEETVGRRPYKGMPNEPIPTPENPKDAWMRFLASRGGILGTTFNEVMTGKDFAGRPIDRADDQEYHQISNRVLNIMLNMLPTGQAEFARAIAQGEDPRIAAGSVLTGSRPRRIDSQTEHFQVIEEIKKTTRTEDDKYRNDRQSAYTHNREIDQNIENVLSGRVNVGSDPSRPLPPGTASNMTATDRKNLVANLGADRRSMREQLFDMAAQVTGPERALAEQMIQYQQEMEVIPGKAVPADVDWARHPELDANELFRLAWNRDPDQVAWLKGELPPKPQLDWRTEKGQHQIVEHITDGLRDWLGRIPGGKDKEQQLGALRNRWTVKAALDWGVDPAVMNDLVKAKVYQIGELPKLPGVTSEQLDELTDQYQAAGRTREGKNITDPEMAALNQQEYLLKTAGELGVDPKALAQRIKLRTLPATDTSPEVLSYSHARDVLNDARLYKYQNEDGTPYGKPSDWARWDTQIAEKRALFDYQDHAGFRVYTKGGNREVDRELTDAFAARQIALANKYKDVRASPFAKDFYRWYGDGVNMTDEQWKQYQNGTLDMWRDKPNSREATNRNEALRVWASLTPQERNQYGLPAFGYRPIEWTAYLANGRTQTRRTSLANYIGYINAWRLDKYKLGDIDPLTGETVSSEED